MQATISKILYYAGWVLAFCYTATCTYFLFSNHVPPSAWWLPVVVLAFFEYGMVKWLHYTKHGARNAAQYCFAVIMTVLCGLAIVASAGMQTLSWLGTPLPDWTINLVEGYFVVVIGLNVLSLIGVSLTEPEHIAHMQAMGVTAPVRVVESTAAPAEIDYDRIISGVTASLSGPQTDPLAQRSLPSQAKATAKQSK